MRRFVLPNGKLIKKCPQCGYECLQSDLEASYMICPSCSYYYSIPVRKRIKLLTDKGSFRELFSDFENSNLIDFPNYNEKINSAKIESGEKEAAVCGECRIYGQKCLLFIMEPLFMMGSMGTIVGEKITLCFEYAEKNSLPVVGICASGGARMQEGLFSLMQMAKTMGALSKHSEKGNLFISMLTNPTTGGVMASFAMNGDIILAEPGATVGFAGRRIVQTIENRKLPFDFQTAEFLMKNGYVDYIANREEQKKLIGELLFFHDSRRIN